MRNSCDILLVERDRDLLSSLPTALRRVNPRLRVEAASCPEEGFRRLTEREYQTVICGVEEPECLNLLAYSKTRQPATPFVLLTDRRNENLRDAAHRAGANFVLLKVPGGEATAEMLSYVLETCALVRRNRERVARVRRTAKAVRRITPSRRRPDGKA